MADHRNGACHVGRSIWELNSNAADHRIIITDDNHDNKNPLDVITVIADANRELSSPPTSQNGGRHTTDPYSGNPSESVSGEHGEGSSSSKHLLGSAFKSHDSEEAGSRLSRERPPSGRSEKRVRIEGYGDCGDTDSDEEWQSETSNNTGVYQVKFSFPGTRPSERPRLRLQDIDWSRQLKGVGEGGGEDGEEDDKAEEEAGFQQQQQLLGQSSWDSSSTPSLSVTPAVSEARLRRQRGGWDAWRHWLRRYLKMEMSRRELIKKYKLHVFVGLIFLVTVLSVSLSWHYRYMATKILHSSQAIFFDPRTRQLTLTGRGNSMSISGQVGLDMPAWQLPLHCPIVMGDNPHAKECVWKNNAVLRIAHFTAWEGEGVDESAAGGGRVDCYNVSWESLHPRHVPHDCFDISDDQWYGPSNQSQSAYPVRGKFAFNPSNYTVGNNGVFSTAVDFYWVSARGVALRVSADDPVQVFWNQTGDNKLCILSNYTGPFYHQENHVTAPNLNYTLCTGPDAVRTHSFMLSKMATTRDHQPEPPSADTLQGAHWSIRGYLGETEVNQTHVVKLAERLRDAGFESNKITVDGKWQAAYGDLTFDPARFPNVTQMFEDLSSLGCDLTMSVSPYFEYSSDNFKRGVTGGKFVQDAGGSVTGLANSAFGLAAVADVSTSDARHWFQKRLHGVRHGLDPGAEISAEVATSSSEEAVEAKVKGFRLTYGRGAWLPYKPHFRLGELATPNMFRRQMTESLSGLAPTFIVEHTSDSRHVMSLVPVQAHLAVRGDKLCLTGVIETALTLGLMGYPYIMADGISRGSGRDIRTGEVSRELYIRWLEMATLFPAHQHSVTPWQFSKEVDTTAAMGANITRDNEALKMAVLKDEELLEEVTRGLPILRPVWWNESTNQTAHAMQVTDEFLLGNKVLVAPVLCEGITARDIHLPRGVWQDHHVPTSYVIGPATIRDYSVPLGQVAVFKKVADTDTLIGNKDGTAL